MRKAAIEPYGCDKANDGESEMNKRKRRKKERKTNLHQQPTVIAMAMATATENKKRCLHRDENCMVMCWSTSRQTKRSFFVCTTIQSKAKQSEASFMYHPKLQCFVCGCVCTVSVCVLQPEPQSRSFIICFQLRFDSLHERAVHTRVTRATTRQSHTIYLYCYTHSNRNCGRYYDKSVSIASHTVQHHISLV